MTFIWSWFHMVDFEKLAIEMRKYSEIQGCDIHLVKHPGNRHFSPLYRAYWLVRLATHMRTLFFQRFSPLHDVI